MLVDELKKIYGSSMVLAIKTRAFHHNVTGENFPQFHDFFQKLYDGIYDQTDKCAELIRQLDSYAPSSMSRMIELSVIDEQTKIPRADGMLSELLEDNLTILDLYKSAFVEAESENEQGIADFIAERIDFHGKSVWMLRSTTKRGTL
jgi:starvation-inducible DNA-binding protein